jgi:para-aminobenzoate synthetase/4-amino-4-deoxychorismate lyase
MDKGVSAVLRAAGRDERPFALVGAWSGGRALVGSEPLLVAEDVEDPFAVLDEQPELTGTVPGATGGGWVGYLGYGLGRLLERLPASPPRPVPLPISTLAFYDHLLTRDESGRWWFEALWSDEHAGRLEGRLAEWRRRAGEPEAQAGQFACGRFLLRPEPETHLVSVARAIEHIRSGDVFQVNVCTRLEAGFSGDPLELFCAGADRLAPRYGAFLGHRSFAVASFSPELFLKRRGREVLSSPIKGTARRQGSSAKAREELRGSEKDRAENLMIVDLVRNDLGRVCRYGSVEVPALCRAEEHPGVWHLVSDVTGELCEAVSDAELLRAAFPPGSVTGAPKVRAMELVTVLEGTAREVYTGAIGIASPLTGLELNVAIRTFELAEGKVWLGVGGGVVADSEPDRELEECLDKARPLLAAIGAELGPARRARGGLLSVASEEGANRPALGAGVFETILVIDGRPVELESHLGRLAASVSSLYGSQPSPRLGAQVVEAAASSAGSQRLRVRVYPSPGGGLRSEVSLLAAPEAFSGLPAACVALVPTVLAGGLGRHKWHDRRVLSDRRGLLGLGPHEQLLLVDEDGAVLETEQASVFAVFGEVVRTPPVDGRILAGTTREAVVRLAALEGLEVSEESFALADLASAEEVFLTSSIRGLCTVGGLRLSRSFQAGPVSARLAKALWTSWNRVLYRNLGLVPGDVHG